MHRLVKREFWSSFHADLWSCPDDPESTSGERDRLDGNKHTGDVGTEVDHRPRWLCARKEVRISLVHLSVEVRPREAL